MKTSKEPVRVSSSVDTATETGEQRLSKIGIAMRDRKDKGEIISMRAVMR